MITKEKIKGRWENGKEKMLVWVNKTRYKLYVSMNYAKDFNITISKKDASNFIIAWKTNNYELQKYLEHKYNI